MTVTSHDRSGSVRKQKAGPTPTEFEIWRKTYRPGPNPIRKRLTYVCGWHANKC